MVRRQASGGRGHSILLVVTPNKEDHARKFVGIKILLHQIGATWGNLGAHIEASWRRSDLYSVPEIYRIMRIKWMALNTEPCATSIQLQEKLGTHTVPWSFQGRRVSIQKERRRHSRIRCRTCPRSPEAKIELGAVGQYFTNHTSTSRSW